MQKDVTSKGLSKSVENTKRTSALTYDEMHIYVKRGEKL